MKLLHLILIDKEMDKMKVFFEPIKNNENAYIKNIITALKNNGIEFYNEDINSKIFKAWNYLKALLKKEKIIFHFNWVENITEKKGFKFKVIEKLYLVFVCIAHIFGKKVVWTMHNTISHHCDDIKRTEKFLKNWIKLMDLIIVHCNESKAYLINKYNYDEKQICVVPHGKYNTNEINNNKLKELKDKYGIHNEIVYMYFGKLDNYKNIPLLINVFEKLNLKNAKLLICGSFAKGVSNDVRLWIENHNYESNIILDNRFIPEEEISILLKIADVLVLPYDRTSMQNSGAAILAISNGVPFIIPEFGYISDIKEFSFVHTYSYQDEKEHFKNLSYEILKFYSNFDRNILNEISEKEKNFAKINLDWNAISKKIIIRYKKLFN